MIMGKPSAASSVPTPGVAAKIGPAEGPRAGLAIRALICLAPLLLVLLPAPDGLPEHAWCYLSLFVAVIVGLILEPIPSAAVGLVGVVAAAALAPFVLYGPAQLANPGFNVTTAAISWALAGFSNTTVWL